VRGIVTPGVAVGAPGGLPMGWGEPRLVTPQASWPLLDRRLLPSKSNGDDFLYRTPTELARHWTVRPGTGGGAFPLGSAIFLAQGTARPGAGLVAPLGTGADVEVIVVLQGPTVGTCMAGVGFVNDLGDGCTISMNYSTARGYAWRVGTYDYVSTGTQANAPGADATAGIMYALAVRRVGITFTSKYSLDGVTWVTHVAGYNPLVYNGANILISFLYTTVRQMLIVHRVIVGPPGIAGG
jgi:hypothetical protein